MVKVKKETTSKEPSSNDISLSFKDYISEDDLNKKGVELNADDSVKYIKYEFSQIMSDSKNIKRI